MQPPGGAGGRAGSGAGVPGLGDGAQMGNPTTGLAGLGTSRSTVVVVPHQSPAPVSLAGRGHRAGAVGWQRPYTHWAVSRLSQCPRYPLASPGTPRQRRSTPQARHPRSEPPSPRGQQEQGRWGQGWRCPPATAGTPLGTGLGKGRGALCTHGDGGEHREPTGRAGDGDRDGQGTQSPVRRAGDGVRQGTGGCAGCVSGGSPGRCHQPCPGAGEGAAASPALQPGRRVLRVRPQDTQHAARHEPLAALAAAPAPLRDLPALPAWGDQPGTRGVTGFGVLPRSPGSPRYPRDSGVWITHKAWGAQGVGALGMPKVPSGH